MKRSTKHKIGLGLFSIMCVIVWWSITEDHSADEKAQQSKKTHYVELFMNEFELISMDENGKPSYLMTGTHLQRYNNSDVTEVKQPKLHLLQQENQWLVSADSALLNSKDNTIHLKNNVVMQQKNVEPALTMHTDRMMVHTKTQIAQTKAEVKISQGESELNAKGMTYNNTTSELKLLSRVKGFYTPTNVPSDADNK